MPRFTRYIALLILSVFSMTAISHAQKLKPKNLPNYDLESLHFGFSLGINKAYFVLSQAAPSEKPDSVLSVESVPDLGFNLGIISDLKLHQYATVRFLPALTFQERTVEYRIHPTSSSKPDSFYVVKKRVESTLLDFPLNLKIRSERVNNAAAYLLIGGKWSIDLASQARTVSTELLKLTSSDYSFEAGFGLDFYLEYFKLSTEIKFSAGIPDRLFHENTTWAAPINRVVTKNWLFSLNFEG